MIGHLCVETNYISKVLEETSIYFNQIWGDPIVMKLKISSWGNY